MILLPRMTDPDWLHARYESGLLRASARLLSGDFEGIGFHTSSDLSYPMTLRSGACPPNDIPCVVTSLLPIPPISSHIPPYDFIVFALLTIESGARGAFEKHALSQEQVGGEEQAGAHVFGAEDIQAVMEVGGDDEEAVLRHVLRLTDFAGVTRVRTLHTTREHTRGFGGRGASAL
jgi:uncharacterized protein with GYD domain